MAEVDHRSDIFSFGAILHEMITGRRAFRRETMAETMTAILKEGPEELSETNPNISPALVRIVHRCLEKKPERRFQSTSDLGFALESLSALTSSSSPSGSTVTTAASVAVAETKASVWSGRLPWIGAGAFALIVAAILGSTYLNRSFTNAKAIRLSFDPPANLSLNDLQQDAAVISPDGQKIGFTATSTDGKSMLYIRDLDSSEVKLLPGSENALESFWSPDSRSIAFGSNGKLKRSNLTGGNAQVLCDSARIVGGTWNKEGMILFAPDYRTTLVQVSAQGGEPKPVTLKADDEATESDRFPYFLPDGRHFLFRRDQKGIWAGSLDSSETKQLLPETTPFVYARPGWLVFVRNDALVAQAFDAAKIALNGEPIPIITDQKNSGWLRFSVSDNGVFIWQGQWERDYQLVWFDRDGKQTDTVDAPRKVNVGEDPHLSPDGKRLLVKRNQNLWIIDLEKKTSLRITSTFSQIPVWSPDGSRIAYSEGVSGLTIKPSNGPGDAEGLLLGANFPSSWSPDGRFIIFLRRGVKTRMACGRSGR